MLTVSILYYLHKQKTCKVVAYRNVANNRKDGTLGNYWKLSQRNAKLQIPPKILSLDKKENF